MHHRHGFTLIELPKAVRNLRPCSGRAGFTLIELLVVITIIVVLLALLVPALDKALYQAELAVCGATLNGVGTGVVSYAMSFKRRYPHRPAVFDPDTSAFQADQLAYPASATGQRGNVNGYDDRPMLRPFVPMKSLLCALSGNVDLDTTSASAWVYSNYAMWFGWRYRNNAQGMLKVGDRLGWSPTAQTTYRFNVLAADHTYNLPSFDLIESAHPDNVTGVLSLQILDDNFDALSSSLNGDPDATFTRSVWGGVVGTYNASGDKDLNYLFDDGSVRRFDAVDHRLNEDKRMVAVPNSPEGTAPTFYQLLPDKP